MYAEHVHLVLYCTFFCTIYFFFFLMIRRPPRSTLFPYNDALPICAGVGVHAHRLAVPLLRHLPGLAGRRADRRSEEHTSELQSPCNLVCRLLLEKKKCQLSTRSPGQRTAKRSSHLTDRSTARMSSG